MIFTKGDIVIIPVPFTDNIGCKLRPAVVISDDTVHKTGDVMIVQITSKHKPDNLSIVLSSDDVSEPLEKDFPFSAPNPRNAPKRGRGS